MKWNVGVGGEYYGLILLSGRDSLEMRFCVGGQSSIPVTGRHLENTGQLFQVDDGCSAVIKGLLQENTDLYVWEREMIKNNKHTAKKNEYACGLKISLCGLGFLNLPGTRNRSLHVTILQDCQ